MITVAALLIFIGFTMCYFTSQKAIIPKSAAVYKIRLNAGASRIAGLIFLASGMIAAIAHSGFASGIFTFLILLMTLGSLVVVIAPLRTVGLKVLIPCFILAAALEFLLT